MIASGQTALADPFTMTIGGVPATVTYAGLVPGWVGSYQFDVVVPSNFPTGDLAVQFTLNAAAIGSQALFLSVSGASSSAAFRSDQCGGSEWRDVCRRILLCWSSPAALIGMLDPVGWSLSGFAI